MELFIFLILLVWTLIWKGIALWKAARLYEKNWFIALLILNTFGILEILYVFVFSEKKQQNNSLDSEKSENKLEE
jgi:uncharacterized membrane protein YiaA